MKKILPSICVVLIFSCCSSRSGSGTYRGIYTPGKGSYNVCVTADSGLNISKVKVLRVNDYHFQSDTDLFKTINKNTEEIFNGKDSNYFTIDSNTRYYLITYDSIYVSYYEVWANNKSKQHNYTLRFFRDGADVNLEFGNGNEEKKFYMPMKRL